MFSEQMKRRERRGEQENASWCIICLCEIIKGDQFIEALCVSPVMILLTALFFFLPLNYNPFTSSCCPTKPAKSAGVLTVKNRNKTQLNGEFSRFEM